VFWGNPIPVVAAVVRYAGGVLLARNRQHPPDCFSLITGFLERGETPDEGVLREVREELGLDGRLNGLLGYYSLLEKNELTLV
jgi:ADP-ribose pyrophosphatase YjhB (NUDIX family)